jgi:ABC-type Fe3+-hydroxamate transport system substrate-binding protein
MASYTVAAGKVGAYEKTLVGSTVDTVTFADTVDRVEVINHDTALILYVRLDSTDPTVSGAEGVVVPPGVRTINVRRFDPTQNATEVRVISSGTPKYSVAKASV